MSYQRVLICEPLEESGHFAIIAVHQYPVIRNAIYIGIVIFRACFKPMRPPSSFDLRLGPCFLRMSLKAVDNDDVD